MNNSYFVKKLVDLSDKFISVLRMICVVLSGIFITLMVIQVIFRYLFVKPIYGLEELVTAMMVWYVAIGVAVIFWENAHALIEYFLQFFSKTFRAIVEFTEHIIIILSAVLFVVSGQLLFKIQVKTNPVGGLPFTRAYYNALPMIVMGVMLLIASTVRFIQFLFDREKFQEREKKGGLLDG